MTRIVTVATKEMFYMKWLKESCSRNGTELIVLGDGEKWDGYITKINIFKSYLDTLDDNEIVCFVDAYDVMMLRDVNHLTKLFLDFEKENLDKIVISQEIRFVYKGFYIPWLEEHIKNRFGSESYSKTMNSGGIIGRVRLLKHIWSKIIEISLRDNNNDDESCVVTFDRENPGTFYVDTKRIFFDSIFDPFSDEKYYPTIAVFIHKVANGRMINLIENYGYSFTEEEKEKIKKQEASSFTSKMKYHGSSFNPIEMVSDFIKSPSINDKGSPLSLFLPLRILTDSFSDIDMFKDHSKLLTDANDLHCVTIDDRAGLGNQKGIILLSSHYYAAFDVPCIKQLSECYITMHAVNTTFKFEECVENGIIPYYGQTEQYGHMVKETMKEKLLSGNNVLIFGTGTKDNFGDRLIPKKGTIRLSYENGFNICTINVVDDTPSSYFEDFIFGLTGMSLKSPKVITNDILDPSLYPSFEIYYDAVVRSLNKNAIKKKQLV